MILLLIRHGESKANLLNVHEGHADFELTPKGHEQAKRQADYIGKHYHISKIYSSPLKRAKQTAFYLDKFGLKSEMRSSQFEQNERIIKDSKDSLVNESVFQDDLSDKFILEEDLMEFNNGLLAGLPRDVALKRYPPIKNLPYDQSVYEMESRLEFRKRAQKVLHKIISKEFEIINYQEFKGISSQKFKCFHSQERCIAIVSHGGVIDQMYKVILNLPIDTALSFKSADTGFHEWKVEKSGISIIRCNQWIGNFTDAADFPRVNAF